MRFRPCIDLHKGLVKQIVGGTLTDTGGGLVTNFETAQPPAYFAELYKSNGLAGGHVIMLGGGNEGAAVNAIRAYPNGLQAGGGITPNNAREYLDAGASHVIVTSYVFSGGKINWERLDELCGIVPKEKLVLDLSCRKTDNGYFVATDRWQRLTNEKLTPKLFERLADRCDEFLVHAADVEGLQGGVDAELVKMLGDMSPIVATYAGGVRGLDDMDLIERVGGGRVDATVGSALDIFGGRLKFVDVVEWHNVRNK